MSSKNTSNTQIGRQLFASTSKFSTPSSITPVKPLRSTLSTSKKMPTPSSKPALIKQTSDTDLREHFLNRKKFLNDDVLNTAFSSTVTPSRFNSKFSSKSKLSTASNPCTSSNSDLSRTSSAKSSNDITSATKTPIRKLFGCSTPNLFESENRTPECFTKVLLDSMTPQYSKKTNESQKYDDEKKTKENSEMSNLIVAVRVRPMNPKECTTPSVINVISVDANEVNVFAGTNADSSAGVSYSFQYDYAFSSYDSDDAYYANQETVFKGTTLPLIDNAFEGYNACLFAYGMTGSGKSYSMMGIDSGKCQTIQFLEPISFPTLKEFLLMQISFNFFLF